MDSSLLLLLLLLPLVSKSQSLVDCDFDYGENCLPGLRTASFVLLNESTVDDDPPRQPPSDVSAIELFNDDGECSFPFLFGSIPMYFCVKTDVDLPSTCPIKDGNGTKRNCSEGEYGYELFSDGEIGSREYQLDLDNEVEQIGEHCFGIDYFLSDGNSLGKIFVIIEDQFNRTILQAQQREENRWNRIDQTFNIQNRNPKFYIGFERRRRFPSDSDLPFYLAIDRIRLLDLPCGPGTTTTTVISTTQTSSTTTTLTTITTTTMTSSRITSTSSSTSSTTTTSTSSTSPTSTSTSTSVTKAVTTTTASLPTSSRVTTTTTSVDSSSSSMSVRWNVLLSIFSLVVLFD